MEILKYIYNDIVPLSPQERINEAINHFKNHACTHIVVVEDGLLKGILSEIDVDVFEEGKTVGDYEYLYQHFSVNREMNWLDVLQQFGRYESNIMPVLDENHQYLGYYELTNVMNLFGEMPFLTEPGAVLVVEKAMKEYAMSELAQIIEAENAKFIGAIISEMRDNNIQLTIKINTQNYNDVLQSLRRYGYKIVYGVKDDQLMKNLKERSDYLNMYLNL
jgi:CBS-domain-containing membrane protein